MAAAKVHARAQEQDELDLSDASAQSERESESADQSDSDSDSLDSQASRKRRKISPLPDDDEPRVAVSSVPSRIKLKASSVISKGTSTVLAPTDPVFTFTSLDVTPWLVTSLSNMAIKRPTGIQKGCIPEILNGRDCIGGSRTGSGKTVAFAVPILQKWAEDPFGIFGLVLTPTRELALQIYEQFKAISAPQSLKAVLITGGTDMRPQATALAQRPHIVIATPGRLADHIRTSGEDTICALRRVRMVVLDEADRLLAGGSVGSMLPDVEECLSILPPPAKRQTLLFTATITPEVRALKELPRTPGKLPVFVCEVDTQALAIPASLKQMHLQIPVTHREHYLHMFLL
ncbi:ATP-dependent RNA helicase dbp8, partial [Lachnellula suecica]